ncbi:hypothetical protein Cgig2_011053 [Carnegiea gigantea]|uniref:Uncharacterized protein n=1 Tax=Carnegiea gigantea TaxID=171969 RepID=A0A9Q1GHA4_9CARY|nr:hypothetical protein Cgig2_011053 [Carnegiea gigantea]
MSEELWRRLTRSGHFPTSTTYQLTEASPPIGRSRYCLPVIQSGGEKYLSQTEAVGPIWSSYVDARQQDPAATPRRGQWLNQRLLPHLMQPIPCGPPGSRSKSRLPSLEEKFWAGSRDEECSTEVVATIAGVYAEEITGLAWKAQLRSAHGQEVNPTGIIHLPVCFGNKLKSKNLEVDFLVVDVPTAYNVILGRPTLHKSIREKRGGLHIGHSTILLTLLLRSLGLNIQGVSRLVPCAFTFTRRRNKFHLFEMAFVGFEIAVLLKFLSQRLQDLAQIPHGVGTTLLIALLLGLSHPLSRRSRLSFDLLVSSRPPGHLGRPSAFPNTADIGSPAPPGFDISPQLSPP